MGDLLESLVWEAKSGQYCVIGSGLVHSSLICPVRDYLDYAWIIFPILFDSECIPGAERCLQFENRWLKLEGLYIG
jgi:hypothetical protein